MITFAERLLSLRTKQGYTQEQLATLCGVSQSTIASYESGTRLHPRNLLSLAKALGVSPLWLEKGQGNITPTTLHEASQPYHNSAWPFKQTSPNEYKALSAQQQQVVEDVLRTLVSSFSKN